MSSPDQELSALLGTQTVGIAVLDRELRYVHVNELVAALNQAPVDAHVGKTVHEMMPRGGALLGPLLEQVLEGGQPKHAVGLPGTSMQYLFDFLPVKDGKSVVGVVLVTLKVGERRRTEAALAARLRFAELVSEVSTGFIDLPAAEIDRGIELALRVLGTGLALDRTYVALASPDGATVTMTHQWCAEGVPASFQRFQQVPLSVLPRFLPGVLRGEPTIVHSVSGLPMAAEADAELLKEVGVRAVAALPLTVAGEVIGLVGFAQTRSDRTWSPEVMASLRLVAEIIANALDRRRAEEARRRAYDELAQLKASIEQERDYLREEIRVERRHSRIIGESPALREVLDTIDAVAGTTATVLLRGESGVGKGLFATEIHARSARASGPLVRVNCATIPAELFESEFFGHVKGAFTGAVKDRSGRFELADGGTLFLDEIGEIPLDLQSKLLRVLQESEFERVGDDRTRRVDVRIVAATNRNLDADVAAGRFRQDLYYRLTVFPVEIPPLRARREDIVLLAEHYLASAAKSIGRAGLEFSAAQRAQLTRYEWPGNIRELEHVIERAVILSRSPPLRLDLALPSQDSETVPPRTSRGPLPAPDHVLKDTEVRALERESIKQALERAEFRVAGKGGAAEMLGLSPSTLRDRMRTLGIARRA